MGCLTIHHSPLPEQSQNYATVQKLIKTFAAFFIQFCFLDTAFLWPTGTPHGLTLWEKIKVLLPCVSLSRYIFLRSKTPLKFSRILCIENLFNNRNISTVYKLFGGYTSEVLFHFVYSLKNAR